jgi:hypothetical protein
MTITTTNAPSSTDAARSKHQVPVTKNDILGATLSLSFSAAVTRAVQAFERERSGAGAGALAWVRWGSNTQRNAAHYEDGVESEFGEDQSTLDEKSAVEAWLAGLAVDDRIVRLPGDSAFVKPRQRTLEVDVEVDIEPESLPHSALSSPVSISFPSSPAPEQEVHDEWEHVVADREDKATTTWPAKSLRTMPRRVPRTLRRLSALGSTRLD